MYISRAQDQIEAAVTVTMYVRCGSVLTNTRTAVKILHVGDDVASNFTYFGFRFAINSGGSINFEGGCICPVVIYRQSTQ